MTLTANTSSRSRSAAIVPEWLVAWALLALAITLLWFVGFRPNADLDDVMKMHELRHVFASGSLLDRTIPGVEQPEPMVSHWPWIVDAPYLLVAGLLNVVLPLEAALNVASLIVPPLLLLAAVWMLAEIIKRLGFENGLPVLLVSAAVALLSATEFQPGRIDYHNLQMICLVGVVLTTMQSGVRPAFGCGLLVALSLAISAELAGFLALALAIFASRFVLMNEDGATELRSLGTGLIIGSLALYVLIAPPAQYGVGIPDRYSAAHVLALCGAGLTFVIAGLAAPSGVMKRAALIVFGAAATLGAVLWLYPQMTGGPYAALSPYVRQIWLGPISQDASVLDTPDFVSGLLFALIAPAFLGLGATLLFAMQQGRKSRAWAVYALFAAAVVVQALLALRFMRVVPLLAGPGVVLVLATVLPSVFGRLAQPFVPMLKPSLLAPGLLLVVGLYVLPSFVTARDVPVSGVMIADSCSGEALPQLTWPRGSRVLAPPALGTMLLDPYAGVSVVAVPFHTVYNGLERVYRFFDGATADPEAMLMESGATHVVSCAIGKELARRFETSQPLAVRLGLGEPPSWLKQCPLPTQTQTGAELHVYVAGSIVCPSG